MAVSGAFLRVPLSSALLFFLPLATDPTNSPESTKSAREPICIYPCRVYRSSCFQAAPSDRLSLDIQSANQQRRSKGA